jgi:hypothetical protein
MTIFEALKLQVLKHEQLSKFDNSLVEVRMWDNQYNDYNSEWLGKYEIRELIVALQNILNDTK